MTNLLMMSQSNKIACPDCGYEMYVGFYETRHKNSKACGMYQEIKLRKLV